jgi:hypothetical protein
MSNPASPCSFKLALYLHGTRYPAPTTPTKAHTQISSSQRKVAQNSPSQRKVALKSLSHSKFAQNK